MFRVRRFRSLALIGVILLLCLTAGCGLSTPAPTPLPPATQTVADEAATLNSLRQLDDYPLYTMRYVGAYPLRAEATPGARAVELASLPGSLGWGCSLVAALGDPAHRLYGRDFDWRFSPALLLYTDPADGYASVSMVDIDYLGFGGERAQGLAALPLDERRALLRAPLWPFDGMNEAGLAIGMAAVPAGEMRNDPRKKNTDNLQVMREILDHAGSVDQAIEMFGGYNIDMGTVPLHYLVASATGEAALIEFYRGKMVVTRQKSPWLHATNFIIASTNGRPAGNCARYDRISQRLQETQGRLAVEDAFGLLAAVSQGGTNPTQWSIVYDMTSGDIQIVMGRKYAEKAHTLPLWSR